MFETILIILLCIILLSGIGDIFFNILGFGVKLFLSIVLVIASAYLAIKMLFVMIPWIFAISLVAFIVGLIWLIKVLLKKV